MERVSPTRILNLQVDTGARAQALEDKAETKTWRTEAQFQEFVMRRFKVLEEYGFCFAVKHSDRVQVGEPDITVFVAGGVTLYLELKRFDGKRSKMQMKWHARLKAYGFEVYVPKTWREIKDLLHEQGVPVYDLFKSTRGEELRNGKKKGTRG